MAHPLLSIIIPTYNRPRLLPHAVKSALAQTLEDIEIEVIVVDDASSCPIDLPKNDRLRVIHLPKNRGGSAARNIGAKVAKGRWISYLDDDDRLLPNMVQVSLEGLQRTTLPQPVAVLSGIEVIDTEGNVKQTRLPPTLPKGSHFGLEEIDPNQSFFCKQTMVIEKDIFLDMGGFDESFTSRIHTELFLRLNQVCSIQGLPLVTYQLLDHQQTRASNDPQKRQLNFNRLLTKHRSLFDKHPKMFANFLYDHAVTLYESDQKSTAINHLAQAIRVHPIHTIARMASPLKKQLLSFYRQSTLEIQ